MTISQKAFSGDASAKSPRSAQIGMHGFDQSGGGVDRYVTGLVGGLVFLGAHTIVGVFSDEKGVRLAHVLSLGRPDQNLLRRWARLRGFLGDALRGGGEIVASHFALYGFPMRSFGCRVPHVVHFHGPWALESGAEGQGRLAVWCKRQVELLTYSSATRCVVLSQAFADVLAKRYRVPVAKIRIIPGGVDTAHFISRDGREAARRALGWPVGVPIVFCVRRLARRMGLDVLLEAFVQVRRQHPRVRLMIGGRGTIADELAERARALGLGEVITWLGFVAEANLPLCYEAADLSVVPSQSLEGFGLVAIESLACGTPVMVTPVGGMPEVVAPLDPRLVLAGTTADAIASGISAALSHPESLPSGTACRDYAERNFGWPHIARQVLKVYQEAVDEFENQK